MGTPGLQDFALQAVVLVGLVSWRRRPRMAMGNAIIWDAGRDDTKESSARSSAGNLHQNGQTAVNESDDC